MNRPIYLLEEYKKGVDAALLRAKECFNIKDEIEIKHIQIEIQSAINVLNHFRSFSTKLDVKYPGIPRMTFQGLMLQLDDIQQEIDINKRRNNYLYNRKYKLNKKVKIEIQYV